MGQEANCVVRANRTKSQGRALLETDEIIFRPDDKDGAKRLKIPFGSMKSVNVKKGELWISHPGGTAVFELGDQAEKWAHKILNPKSLLEKLDVKPNMRVSIVGMNHNSFTENLGEVAGDTGWGFVLPKSDLVFLAADSRDDLERLAGIKESMKANGAVWVVYRKGQKAFGENHVLEGGKAAGLVDTKVVRFSDTHTASKFVIPKAKR